ncbi:MAG: hypothetical protein F6K31_00205 [Symploca sp. SIO2G7]|nr:hypothetical protein [Symploca sp. SIO2G7]
MGENYPRNREFKFHCHRGNGVKKVGKRKMNLSYIESEILNKASSNGGVWKFLKQLSPRFHSKDIKPFCLGLAKLADEVGHKYCSYNGYGTSFSMLRDLLCRFFYPNLPIRMTLLIVPTGGWVKRIRSMIGGTHWLDFLLAAAVLIKQHGGERYSLVYNYFAVWH